MSNGTALEKRSSEFAEKVRKGANLPEERWSEERVAAAVRLLPAQYQDPVNAIGFLAMAHSYGLDPFAKEIWGWENPKTGKLQTMVSRDGWTKILRRDPEVASVQADQVREGDTFKARRTETGRMDIEHETNPFEAGPVVGAYALIRFSDERPDIFQARKLDDYSHLQNKENWRNHAQEMILTRVLSFAGRLATGAALHTEADFELKEDQLERSLQGATDATEARMMDSLEAEVVEEDDGAPAPEPQGKAGSTPSPEKPPAKDSGQQQEVEASSDDEADGGAPDDASSDDSELPAVELPEWAHLPPSWSVVYNPTGEYVLKDADGFVEASDEELEQLLLLALPHEHEPCGHRFATPQAIGGHARSCKAVQEEASETPSEVEEPEAEPAPGPEEEPEGGWVEKSTDLGNVEGLPGGYKLRFVTLGDEEWYELVSPDGEVLEHEESGDERFATTDAAISYARDRAGYDPVTGTGDQLEIEQEEPQQAADGPPDPYEGKNSGDILTMVYKAAAQLETGGERIYEIANEIGDVGPAKQMKLSDLDREQRIELHKRIQALQD